MSATKSNRTDQTKQNSAKNREKVRAFDGSEPLSALSATPAWTSHAWFALIAATVVLLVIRLYAAKIVGFGDSEALYATWAAHPQPAFLDHPGMIAVVARAIGHGQSPSPAEAHTLTAILASIVPWLAYGAARAFGATRGGAAAAGLVVALAPETAIGLFALTPDSVLAPAWLGTLALAAIGLRGPRGGTRSASAFIAAGQLAGIASASKVSGLLLVVLLFVAYSSIAGRAVSEQREVGGHSPPRELLADEAAWRQAGEAVRSPWPWAGMFAGLVPLVPIVMFEARAGWPMMRHRLVETQSGAGLALRNLGTLFGGQLLYLSPILAALAVVVMRDLWRARAHDPLSRLLFLSVVVPFFPLVALCLWSPVAEPHWLAPALLGLPIHAARRIATRSLCSKPVFVGALSIAASLSLAVHAWVLIPSLGRLLPKDVDPKFDISSELFGWPTAIQVVQEQLAGNATPFDPNGLETIVVGPHWTVCAQLQAALPDVRVGCATKIRDDFDGWLPREQWRHAERVLFVTDNRFPTDGSEQLPELTRTGQTRVRVLRAGRTARIFEFFMYDRRAQGFYTLPPYGANSR